MLSEEEHVNYLCYRLGGYNVMQYVYLNYM